MARTALRPMNLTKFGDRAQEAPGSPIPFSVLKRVVEAFCLLREHGIA